MYYYLLFLFHLVASHSQVSKKISILKTIRITTVLLSVLEFKMCGNTRIQTHQFNLLSRNWRHREANQNQQWD